VRRLDGALLVALFRQTRWPATEKAASSRRTPHSAQRDAPPRHLYPDQSLATREKGLTLRIYSEKVYQ
jgi:hypothetical protein